MAAPDVSTTSAPISGELQPEPGTGSDRKVTKPSSMSARPGRLRTSSLRCARNRANALRCSKTLPAFLVRTSSLRCARNRANALRCSKTRPAFLVRPSSLRCARNRASTLRCSKTLPAFLAGGWTLFFSDPVPCALSLDIVVIFSPGQSARVLSTLRGMPQQSRHQRFFSGLLLS